MSATGQLPNVKLKNKQPVRRLTQKDKRKRRKRR
jgi:hypothetical protein